MSRIAFASLRRRFAVSKIFSASICTKSSPSNVKCHMLAGKSVIRHPESWNGFNRFGSSKMCYSSSSRFTNNNKLPFLLPKEGVKGAAWKAFLIPAALAGFAGLAVFIHYNDENRVVLKGKGVKFERSVIQGPIIGGPFSLVNTEGKQVTEKNLLGNWVLLYFGYTSSPDVGPAELQKMAKSIDILESKQKLKVLPVFVTIDPQRDSPSQLNAYIREFDSRIVGLTGPAAAVRQMAQEYRVFFRKIDEEGDDYLIESSHTMYLLNPNMQMTRSFGVEYSPEELAESITKELKKTNTTIIT